MEQNPGFTVGIAINTGQQNSQADQRSHARLEREVDDSTKYTPYHWAFYALFSALLYAGGFFFLGWECWSPQVAKIGNSIGFLSFAGAYILFSIIKFRCNNNHWPCLSDTSLADPTTKRFRWKLFFITVLAGGFHFLAYFFLVFGFQHSLLIGINQGIATAVLSIGSIFVAIGTRAFFKRSITTTELMGMIVTVVGVVLVAASRHKADVIESPFIMILYLIASAAFFAIRSFINRYLSQIENVDTFTPQILEMLVDGVIGALMLINPSYNEGFTYFGTDNIFNVIFSGWLIGLGVVFLAYAVMMGPVRPIYAIWSQVGLFHTLLFWTFLSLGPGNVEFLALFVILFGSLTTIIGDSVINGITQDSKEEARAVGETSSLLAGRDMWVHRYT